MLSASLSAASACAKPEPLQPIYPPSADVLAMTEGKPRPGPEIVTSARAAAEYDVALEAWGDRVSAAGGRLCRWLKANGMAVECPAP